MHSLSRREAVATSIKPRLDAFLANIQEVVDTCDTEETHKWTSEHVVIEMTSVSLMQMVLSFPSDAERRLQLMRDGLVLGDTDGLDYNFCLNVCYS